MMTELKGFITNTSTYDKSNKDTQNKLSSALAKSIQDISLIESRVSKSLGSIDELSKLIKTTPEGSSAANTELLNSNRDKLQGIDQKIESLTDRNNSIMTELKGFITNTSAADKIAYDAQLKLSAGLTKSIQDMSLIESRVSKSLGSIDNLPNTIDEKQSRLLTTSTNAILSKLLELDQKSLNKESLDESIESIVTKIKLSMTDITSIVEKTTQDSQDIKNELSDVKKFTQDIKNELSEVKSFTKEISEVKTYIQDIKNEIRDMKTYIKDMKSHENIDSLISSVTTTTNDQYCLNLITEEDNVRKSIINEESSGMSYIYQLMTSPVLQGQGLIKPELTDLDDMSLDTFKIDVDEVDIDALNDFKDITTTV